MAAAKFSGCVNYPDNFCNVCGKLKPKSKKKKPLLT
jgi:hypothetical protein